MNTEVRLNIVNNFLDEANSILWGEHKDFMFEMQRKLNEYASFERVTSNFGDHYTNCCWSKNNTTCGPDTCNCFEFERNWKHALDIMNFYSNLNNLVLQFQQCNIN